jgi:DNA-binding sugar fermentation-stimulating protein
VAAFKAATEAGVEAIALRCRVSPEEIVVEKTVPIKV